MAHDNLPVDRDEMLSRMPETYDTKSLAMRWYLQPETIEKWRLNNEGPQPRKIGRGPRARIIYYREDVLDYELANPQLLSGDGNDGKR